MSPQQSEGPARSDAATSYKWADFRLLPTVSNHYQPWSYREVTINKPLLRPSPTINPHELAIILGYSLLSRCQNLLFRASTEITGYRFFWGGAYRFTRFCENCESWSRHLRVHCILFNYLVMMRTSYLHAYTGLGHASRASLSELKVCFCGAFVNAHRRCCLGIVFSTQTSWPQSGQQYACSPSPDSSDIMTAWAGDAPRETFALADFSRSFHSWVNYSQKSLLSSIITYCHALSSIVIQHFSLLSHKRIVNVQ